MLLPILILQLAQSASPSSTVVVVTRRTAVSAVDARAVAVLVTKSLKQAELEVTWDADAAARRLASLGVKDSSGCQGRKACVQEFGRQLDVAVVVGVSVSEVDAERSVALEAVRIADGVVLAHENLLYPKSGSPPVEQLRLFATHIRSALPSSVAKVEPVAPKVETDAPTQAPPEPAPVLAPAPVPLPAVAIEQPPPAHSHAGGLIAGAGALLSVAGAVVLGVLAFSAKADLSRGTTLPGGLTASALTGADATSVSKRANGEFYGAVGCAAAAVALGTTAVVVW